MTGGELTWWEGVDSSTPHYALAELLLDSGLILESRVYTYSQTHLQQCRIRHQNPIAVTSHIYKRYNVTVPKTVTGPSVVATSVLL